MYIKEEGASLDIGLSILSSGARPLWGHASLKSPLNVTKSTTTNQYRQCEFLFILLTEKLLHEMLSKVERRSVWLPYESGWRQMRPNFRNANHIS